MDPNGHVSTGTTIMAIPAKDGVILGADTRVTSGVYIRSRSSDKIVALTEHIFCARSGSAADTMVLSDYVRYYLSQLTMEMGRPVRVKTAAHLMAKIFYSNKYHLSVSMIVAGWDPVDGPTVYNIFQGGTVVQTPYAIGGSGSGYIYGMADHEFRNDMTKEEAETMTKKFISHAMARDGSSGGCIRTVTITPTGHTYSFTKGNELPYGPVPSF